MLGTLGGDLVWPLLERVVEGDGAGTIEEAKRIAARSMSFDAALEEIASVLHRVALAQAGAELPDETDADRVRAMADRLDAPRVQVMYQIALLARRDLPLAPDEYAGFTMALLRMLSFAGNAQQERAVTPKKTAARERPAAGASNAAPVDTPKPASPASATTSAAFDGDWAAFVSKASLTGMAGIVARNSELVSFENNRLELVVPEAHRVYAEPPYTDKLKAELAQHFGSGFRLNVRVGPTSGASVAAIRTREEEEKREVAASAIEADPFVRELVRDFGAEVVTSSIKPADGAREANSGRKG
jgi:DNA polymerase-3 subunit gamma/tau